MQNPEERKLETITARTSLRRSVLSFDDLSPSLRRSVAPFDNLSPSLCGAIPRPLAVSPSLRRSVAPFDDISSSLRRTIPRPPAVALSHLSTTSRGHGVQPHPVAPFCSCVLWNERSNHFTFRVCFSYAFLLFFSFIFSAYSHVPLFCFFLHHLLPIFDLTHFQKTEDVLSISRLCLQLHIEKRGLSMPTEPQSHKVNVEDGVTKSTINQPPCLNSSTTDHNQQPWLSNILTHSGPRDSKDPQKAGPGCPVVVGPAEPSTAPHGLGFPSKSIVIASSSDSSERNFSPHSLKEIGLPSKRPRPVWHAPWKNYRVVSGHLGGVRAVAVDPSNTWFCTGSADQTIKIWDLAKGSLKHTLTGHTGQVRGLVLSNRQTYMFSAGDDKQVLCWDVEQNKVIRSYDGHLSGVYCLALHPTTDILLAGGGDAFCRVWDIRSKTPIGALCGHVSTVCSVFTWPMDQVITGSYDHSIKMWDLRKGVRLFKTLTNHKMPVRAMAPHPKEQSFASASIDRYIIKFNLPNGDFLHRMLSRQNHIITAMAVNKDDVLVTGGVNGSLDFWDWKSGYKFQQAQTIARPGLLDREPEIYALAYDVTGTRLIACGADKTIKMWREDENATPETFPLESWPPKDCWITS